MKSVIINGNEGFIPVGRWPPGRHHLFPKNPGVGGILDAQHDEHHHAGEEEEEVANHIHPALGPGRPFLVEKIGPDMLSQIEGHGAGKPVMDPVTHRRNIDRPERRAVDIPDEDLPDQHRRHREDQPGKDLSRPEADLVNHLDETIDIFHRVILQNFGMAGF